MIRIKYSCLIVVANLIISTSAWSQDHAVNRAAVVDDAAPPLITKFYDITMLTTSQQQFPFDDGFRVRPAMQQQSGGGNGGGGFGGGGGGGFSVPGEAPQGSGGGFFSLPMEPTQFGSGTISYGLAPNQTTELAPKQQLEERGETISDLIMQYVAAESWKNCATGSGEITELGNTLIIRQTASVHQEVGKFLKSLTTSTCGKGIYQIEAWWLPTTEFSAMQLKTLLSGTTEAAAVLEQLATLSQNEGGYHGTLLCRERVTTHMASGKKIPVITASTPVVGTGSQGYSPTTRLLHLGLLLETHVTSIPDFMLTASDDNKSEQVSLSFRSQVTESDAQIQERATFEKVDRYVLSEHSAAGSCRIRIGTPTLVSSLTQLSKQEENVSDTPAELQLVVCVTRADD